MLSCCSAFDIWHLDPSITIWNYVCQKFHSSPCFNFWLIYFPILSAIRVLLRSGNHLDCIFKLLSQAWRLENGNRKTNNQSQSLSSLVILERNHQKAPSYLGYIYHTVFSRSFGMPNLQQNCQHKLTCFVKVSSGELSSVLTFSLPFWSNMTPNMIAKKYG